MKISSIVRNQDRDFVQVYIHATKTTINEKPL